MKTKLFLRLILIGFALTIWCSRLQAQIAFAPAVNYPVASNAVWVTVADINGDGANDLIVSDGDILILTNNGFGQFGSNSLLSIGEVFGPVAVADINGDGKPDLNFVRLNPADGHEFIMVYTNNGTGVFGSNAVYNAGNGPSIPVAADVNGDGALDLLCLNGSDKTFSVYTNSGHGAFKIASTVHMIGGGGSVSPLVIDINGDKKPDLICANGNGVSGFDSGNTLSILTNSGGGKFNFASSPVVGTSPLAVTALDVTGNGAVDLVCSVSNTLRVLTNDGSGNFSLTATYMVGAGSIASLTAADMNGDGKPDLVGTAVIPVFPAIKSIFILTNNGLGGFNLATLQVTGTNSETIAVGDINGDGRPDLVGGIAAPTDEDSISFYTSSGLVSVLTSVPTLASSRFSNNSMMVSWPASWTNWALLQNSDLSTTNWSASSGIVNDGLQKSLSVSASTNLFFRLSHP